MTPSSNASNIEKVSWFISHVASRSALFQYSCGPCHVASHVVNADASWLPLTSSRLQAPWGLGSPMASVGRGSSKCLTVTVSRQRNGLTHGPSG